MSGWDARTRSERLFRHLLALFPRDFRARFGDEMTDVFRYQGRAAYRRGARAASPCSGFAPHPPS